MTKRKDDLYLVIRTNKYTGNFERELMKSCFNISDDEDDYDEMDDICVRFGYSENESDTELSIDIGMDIEEYFEGIQDVYDCDRRGRNYGEYHGWWIDQYPGGSKECDSIYIAINDKLDEDLFEAMKKMLQAFCEQGDVKDLKILSVEYFVEKFERV